MYIFPNEALMCVLNFTNLVRYVAQICLLGQVTTACGHGDRAVSQVWNSQFPKNDTWLDKQTEVEQINTHQDQTF